MHSPLAPAPSRPPPPGPTAEPAGGSRGALPHRIAARWGGTWPDGCGHYGQWSWREAGGGELDGGRGGRARRRGTTVLAGRGTGAGLSPQRGSWGVRTPGNRESPRRVLGGGSPSSPGRPCKARGAPRRVPWTPGAGTQPGIRAPRPWCARPRVPRVSPRRRSVGALYGTGTERPRGCGSPSLLSSRAVGSSRRHPSSPSPRK